MTDNQQKQEGISSRTQIILAVISVVGVLGTAMFTNWEKIHPSSKALLTNSDKTLSSSTDIPPGNYQLTCPTRSVKDDTLTAICYNMQNKLQESSLVNFKRCTFGIENSDGQLVCRLQR
jgi:hypothetical protein